MSARRGDFFSEAIVGLFMLAVISLLAYFTIVISGVDVFQRRSKTAAKIVFKDVGGLKDHDSVMYRGAKVGSVEDIELAPDFVRVTVEIDNGVVLRESCRISVCNLSMLGGNYLLLEEGEGAPLPLDTTEFKGETPTDWMRDVASIAKNINKLTSNGDLEAIVASFKETGESLKTASGRLERGEGTLGKLLSDESIYDEMKTIATNLAAVSTNVREGKGTLGKLLSDDPALYDNLEKTLSDVADVAARLKNGEGLLGRLLSKDDTLSSNIDEAVKSFTGACKSFDAKETIDGANRLVATLNEVADRLKNGEGTLGKLLAEDELYNDVKGLSKDVRQVLDNFRDTTPISTFGSLITGGL